MSLSLLIKAKLEVVWMPNESHYIEKLSRVFLSWQLEQGKCLAGTSWKSFMADKNRRELVGRLVSKTDKDIISLG